MDELDTIYGGLAAGTGTAPTDPAQVDALLERVFRARASAEVGDRLAALRVAEAIGGRQGLDLIETFVDDPDVSVRRQAFRIGVATGADGTRLVREAASDSDPGLASEALDLLILGADRSTTPLARSLLGSPQPAVRARAARLLGHVGGPAVVPELRRLLGDPTVEVREAVTEAIDRLEGRLPKRPAGDWWAPAPWEEGAKPAVPVAASPVAASPVAASPVDAPKPVAEAPKPAGEGTKAPEAPKTPEAPKAPGPDAVLRALAGGEAVVEALRALDRGELGAVVDAHRVGGDPAIGRGIGLAAVALEAKSWLTRVRTLADDPDPGVRAAAVGAIAALGGPAVLMQVVRKLGDASPVVQIAAIEALSTACGRMEMRHMLPGWLANVPKAAPAEVLAARDRALEG